MKYNYDPVMAITYWYYTQQAQQEWEQRQLEAARLEAEEHQKRLDEIQLKEAALKSQGGPKVTNLKLMQIQEDGSWMCRPFKYEKNGFTTGRATYVKKFEESQILVEGLPPPWRTTTNGAGESSRWASTRSNPSAGPSARFANTKSFPEFGIVSPPPPVILPGIMTTTPTRTDHDSLGPRQVPADALYGAQTSRSLENFRLFGTPLPIEIIHGMALLKLACALANSRLGLLPAAKATAIVAAARAVLAGTHDREFPVDLYQAGSGTSSHMNLNEVLANLANESLGGQRGAKTPVHPTTTSTWASPPTTASPPAPRSPSSARPCCCRRPRRAGEIPARQGRGIRRRLQDRPHAPAGRRARHPRPGIRAYARAIALAAGRIRDAFRRLKELGIGGNAVGTGINTKPAFRAEIIKALNEETGGDFRPPRTAST
jgi:hypothetical protein